MRYELFKAITKTVKSEDGKVSTPVIGYLLIDHEDRDIIEYLPKDVAFVLVRKYGCTNAVAKHREFEGETIVYLKPIFGKLSDYLMIEIGAYK